MIGWKKAGSLIGNAILWLAAGGAFTLSDEPILRSVAAPPACGDMSELRGKP